VLASHITKMLLKYPFVTAFNFFYSLQAENIRFPENPYLLFTYLASSQLRSGITDFERIG